MTYPEFERAWLGKSVDYDAAYGYQCVDLIKQYMAQVYGLKPGTWGNAINYWTTTNANILTKFDKVAGSAAKQGDVVVINGTSGNPYGHIGIATGAIDGTNVEILEQNGSTGNGSGTAGDAIRKRFVARSRVAGLLRPKGEDMALTRDLIIQEYLVNRGAAPSEGEIAAHLNGGTLQSLSLGFKAENDAARAFNAKTVADLQKALTNAQNKPAEVVIKEVEKIVEKVVTVEKPVDEKAVVEGWFKKIWQKLFN